MTSRHAATTEGGPSPSARTPRRSGIHPLLTLSLCASAALLASAWGGTSDDDSANQAMLVEQGRQIFRYETFGDEAKWTDALRMHEVISAAVDPVTALSVGLKVDAQALPAAVVDGIRNGTVDLTKPATTIALLKLDAVLGLKATVETVNGQDCFGAWASPARCATRPSTTRSRPASASA